MPGELLIARHPQEVSLSKRAKTLPHRIRSQGNHVNAAAASLLVEDLVRPRIRMRQDDGPQREPQAMNHHRAHLPIAEVRRQENDPAASPMGLVEMTEAFGAPHPPPARGGRK